MLLQVQDRWLSFLKTQIDRVQINSSAQAQWICKLLPSSCPFERNFTLFGHSFHSPALCQLNPLFPQLMLLRYKALTYIASNSAQSSVIASKHQPKATIVHRVFRLLPSSFKRIVALF